MKEKSTKTKNKNWIANPDNYINRELSAIEFNYRVLAEAENPENPLLERLKFCIIVSSNMDEFFQIRVASLKSQMTDAGIELSFDGMSPAAQLKEIKKRLAPLYERQERLLMDVILPELEENGIFIRKYNDLDRKSRTKLSDYFVDNILPALTPISLSRNNRFPQLINRSLNIAFVLKDKRTKTSENKFAFVQIPNILPKFIELDWLDGNQFILIEDLIQEFSFLLFPGMNIITTNTFRVTRDADIEVAEDEAEDLISEIASLLKTRHWGKAAVRLEHSSRLPKYLSRFLMSTLKLQPDDIYIIDRPLGLSDFMFLYSLDIRKLKYKPFAPANFKPFTKAGNNVFAMIKKSDYLLHHPYESFDSSVLKFIDEASTDPDVAAIKITLYRTNKDSDIVRALMRAADNGKFVTALVELKARFDEEKNIWWAKELEKTGAHVVYGVPGLKTHSKIAIVVRKEIDKMRTYVHISTGNYNQITAQQYSDIGLFTANPGFAQDAINFFNHLTGYSYHTEWNRIITAPEYLFDKTLQLIQREIDLHTVENPGLIIAKMNALSQREIINALYKASQKGVKIKLIIRGICCLRPGVPGLSENIEVKSIVGRFLEHSRIIYFRNGGDEKIFLSSADWMSRNMQRRVESMFVIEEEKTRNMIMEYLNFFWKDNTNSWKLNSNGTYTQIEFDQDDEAFSAQDAFLEKTSKLF